MQDIHIHLQQARWTISKLRLVFACISSANFCAHTHADETASHCKHKGRGVGVPGGLGLAGIYYMNSTREAEAGKPCRVHDDSKGCTLPSAVDSMWASGPCQPYTKLRNGCGPEPEGHGGYNATFGEEGSIISIAKKLRPSFLFSEQVLGFGTRSKDSGISPMDKFCAELMDIEKPDGTPHFGGHLSLQIDSNLFVKTRRPRYLLHETSTQMK